MANYRKPPHKRASPNSSKNKAQSKTQSREKNNGKADQSQSFKSPLSELTSLSGVTLDYVVAALLLTGKLTVDSLTLFKEATVVIGLTGRFLTKDDYKKLNDIVQNINGNNEVEIGEILKSINVL